jgi:hypothetical protein
MQPTIRPLFDTRQFQEALMTWTNNPTETYNDYIKLIWSEDILKELRSIKHYTMVSL